jgi:hypothetical protein
VWSGTTKKRGFVDRVMTRGERIVPQSVLDAIREGLWNFEPSEEYGAQFRATVALPGTKEKLGILAERVRQGLPLWHPQDRLVYAAHAAEDD